jgi:anti-anti-sigma regulatory factor
MILVGPSPPVERVFEILGLASYGIEIRAIHGAHE